MSRETHSVLSDSATNNDRCGRNIRIVLSGLLARCWQLLANFVDGIYECALLRRLLAWDSCMLYREDKPHCFRCLCPNEDKHSIDEQNLWTMIPMHSAIWECYVNSHGKGNVIFFSKVKLHFIFVCLY